MKPGTPDVFQKGTTIVASTFAFEDARKLVQDLTEMAERHGLSKPYRVVNHLPKLSSIEPGMVFMTDLPIRLADSVQDMLRWLVQVVERQAGVVIPGTVDLRVDSPCMHAQKQFADALAAFPKQMKAVRIKEGLQMARARGRAIGRRSLTPEQVEVARQAFAEAGSIRGAERLLRAKGHSISRSAIHRIVQNKGQPHE